MLRFRPILPKPPAEGALSVNSQNVVVSKRRSKRKYVRARRKSRSSEKFGKRETKPGSPDFEEKATLVTLQLMPENDAPEPGISRCKNVGQAGKNGIVLDQAASGKKVVESWVTVESVTGTCMGEGSDEGLGCTDEEKVRRLESDTCPGFVTDEWGRVGWVNDAYKRMLVMSSEEEEQQPFPENTAVWLNVKDGAAWCYSYPVFTCGVRLQYTWRNENCIKMVPCDVWRLDSGGFAWRLDVKAALSLGL